MDIKRIAAASAVILAGLNTVASATLTLADGGHHVIDYTVNAPVKIDRDAPGMGTTVDLVDGGMIIAWVDAYEDSAFYIYGGQVGGSLDGWANSRLNVIGGEIGGHVYARGAARLDISGGWMESQVKTFDSAEATISGGEICGAVDAWNESRITISGGILGGRIGAIGSGLVTLVGRYFAVDGTPAAWGDSASDFGTVGVLTGTLANGDALNAEFHLNGIEADILFVPEPVSVLLLGLGGLSLLRRQGR